MLKYSVMFTYLCLSTVLVSSFDFLAYLIKREAFFPVTGASDTARPESGTCMLTIEFLTGAALLAIAAATSNLWLFTVGISLLLSPLVFRYNLDNKALNIFLYLPFIINLFIIFMISRSLE